MRKEILIAALLPSLILLSTEVFAACNYAPNGFYCCTTNAACNAGAGEVDVFHMYSVANAHAELPTESFYSERVCCGGVPGLGTTCGGIYDTVLRLSSQTNAHVEEKTYFNYGFPVCLSVNAGPASCGYTTADCSALGEDYVCLATISSDTNAHVADCDGTNDFPIKVCCNFGYPPCVLTSAVITPNCATLGSPTTCEPGETISMSASYTGDCSDVTFLQIDAAGGCSVQYMVPPGHVSGLSQLNPAGAGSGSGTITGTWAIPAIPLTCSGKTVTASAAAFYNTSSPQEAGRKAMNITPYVTGSFTFKDIVAPVTTITPNGNAPAWSNAPSIPFTLTCTDTGGGSCATTYYKVIDSSVPCAAGGFSTGLSSTVTCASGSNCQSHVCFYSTDTDGNTEAMQTSSVFQIDRTLPTVDVSHSPPSPTDMDLVTFTATASDTGSGLSQISIYVDGSLIGSCGASPCAITPGVYPTGNHNYYATAADAAGNTNQSATKSFAVTGCNLTSATISGNCAGGASTYCEIGETISMSATTTGNCAAIKFFQIDASGSGCSVQYSGGDLSGVSDNTPTIAPGSVSGTWTITDIPLACSGKTVTASAAGLYNPGPPPTGRVSMLLSPVAGSFTFKDITPPTTSIDPDGAAWRSTDVPFTFTCTPAGSPCSATYYKIKDDASACTPDDKTGFSLASPPLSVSCLDGEACQKRVCFYSNDTSGNTEITRTSNLFQIDKAAPTASLSQPPAGWTNQNSIPVAWTGSDSGIGTIASFNVQSRSSWAEDGSSPTTWDWYSGTGTSGTFSPALDNHTYYFQVRATDGVGNTGAYSAERSISVDAELPNISYSVNEDVVNSIITISSSAWDSISGIYNHTISCTVINPDSTIFVQCAQAAQFGGISTCQTPQVSYTQETELNCTMRAQDRAGNVYSTGIFFSPLTDHPLIVFVEHSAFMNIGETYHARVYVRNLKSSPDMINISLGGTYPKDFVTFLESSIITYMSPDKITVSLNAYEQRIINIKVVSADTEQYDLRILGFSQKYSINDSDTMNITVGFPASFPGIDLLSIATILSLSCFAYFRHLRKPK
jgi:hypothetical protein